MIDDDTRTKLTSADCSVVIPTFERVTVLKRAIDSVIDQIEQPGEIIVVDDGSSDGTMEMVQADYPDVRLIRQENSGVSAARNYGISAARGQWVALLDSDDAWRPEKLALQIQMLKANPDIRICHTEEIWIRNGVRVNQMKKHAKCGGRLFEKSLSLCCISPSSVMLHRTLFDEYGGFDETLPACEDYDLWLRLTPKESTVFVETPVTIKYGGHSDQLSRKYWGMDRFRIQSMESLLDGDVLSEAQRRLAIDVLVKKLTVLVGGARKRNNIEVIETYAPKLAHWSER